MSTVSDESSNAAVPGNKAINDLNRFRTKYERRMGKIVDAARKILVDLYAMIQSRDSAAPIAKRIDSEPLQTRIDLEHPRHHSHMIDTMQPW